MEIYFYGKHISIFEQQNRALQDSLIPEKYGPVPISEDWLYKIISLIPIHRTPPVKFSLFVSFAGPMENSQDLN